MLDFTVTERTKTSCQTPNRSYPPYFKSIVDQDRLSIVICDLEHTIIYMNPAAVEDYHKYGGAALIGEKPLKLSQRGFEYEDSSDHRLVCSGFIAQYRLYFTQ